MKIDIDLVFGKNEYDAFFQLTDDDSDLLLLVNGYFYLFYKYGEPCNLKSVDSIFSCGYNDTNVLLSIIDKDVKSGFNLSRGYYIEDIKSIYKSFINKTKKAYLYNLERMNSMYEVIENE